MKHQYFGDLNDYRNYGLLRLLCGGGALRTGVGWMLTADDGQAHGQRIGYLREPEKWRRYDPRLYDWLAWWVVEKQVRDVGLVERDGILPGACYHTDLLADDDAQRRRYFAAMWERFGGVELVFFDPDNGLEVPSTRAGRRGASRYLRWSECGASYARGHSLLIYQHFPREERKGFLEGRAGRLLKQTEAPMVLALTASDVVFFLVPQPERQEFLSRRAERVQEVWAPRISLRAWGEG